MTYITKPKCIIRSCRQHARFTGRTTRARLDIVRRLRHDSISAAIIRPASSSTSSRTMPSSRGSAARRDADLFPRRQPRLQLVHGRMPSV